MKRAFLFLIGFLAGGILVAAAFSFLGPRQATFKSMAIRQSDLNPSSSNDYHFIDPLMGINNGDAVSQSAEMSHLQQVVASYLSGQEASGAVSTASVYYRDEKGLGGFTINPNEKYSPASLLKVPIMMTYYHLSETNPSILSDKLEYTSGPDLNSAETIRPVSSIEKDTPYTINSLIDAMIEHSDNNALALLEDDLRADGQYADFVDLGKDLGISQIDLSNDFITVNAYSMFFRTLYNSTYLSRSSSEKALSVLSLSDFNDGIRASIAADVPIAHKFGEYTHETTNVDPATGVESSVTDERELHDCGIIYYPSDPYVLCVMTKLKSPTQNASADFTGLEHVIGGISDLVYSEVKQRNTAH
jgi:beta-lactamase class A